MKRKDDELRLARMRSRSALLQMIEIMSGDLDPAESNTGEPAPARAGRAAAAIVCDSIRDITCSWTDAIPVRRLYRVEVAYLDAALKVVAQAHARTCKSQSELERKQDRSAVQVLARRAIRLAGPLALPATAAGILASIVAVVHLVSPALVEFEQNFLPFISSMLAR